MSLSWTPDVKANTATTKVNYYYFTSPRTKKYYQHHDGPDACRAAAERFVDRCHPHAQTTIVHDEARQCFLVTCIEPLKKEDTMPQGGGT